MADIQNQSKELNVETIEEEQILNEIKDEIIEQEQRIFDTNELIQTKIIKLTVESEMPIEDLRKLYTSSSNMANVSTPKQDELSTSEEDSSDQDEDSGYQRLLIAEHPTLNENGDEEDIDDSSFSFYWQKKSPNDQLLWSPPLDINQDENSTLVNKYLKLAAKELSSAPWSLTECDQFEQCFKEYGKDFSMFKIANRTVHELIFFYYIWKKSARHDVFVRQNRVEKRRFHLHPYVTDYLEKFFFEQELHLTNAYEQNNSSSSSSTTLNPQLSSDQLSSKRRLSSDVFLKPMSTIKRTKPLIHTNDNIQLDSQRKSIIHKKFKSNITEKNSMKK